MANFLFFKKLGERKSELRFRESKLFWIGTLALLAVWVVAFPFLYQTTVQWDREQSAAKKLELISLVINHTQHPPHGNSVLPLKNLNSLVDLGLLENSDLDFSQTGYTIRYKLSGTKWWIKANPIQKDGAKHFFIDQRNVLLYSLQDFHVGSDVIEQSEGLTSYRAH